MIPPSLFGSGPFLYHKINLLDLDLQRAEKYGKVFGAYILNTPWVFISDPEILKQITIKARRNKYIIWSKLELLLKSVKTVRIVTLLDLFLIVRLNN